MKKYDIQFSKEARIDLNSIVKYIKYNLQEPNIAIKLSNKIKESIYNITANPRIYPEIDDDFIGKLQLRKIIVDNYIVFYKILEEKNIIQIVRILYGRRNWMNML